MRYIVSIYFVMFHVLNAIKRLLSIYYSIPHDSINMQGRLAHGSGTYSFRAREEARAPVYRSLVKARQTSLPSVTSGLERGEKL